MNITRRDLLTIASGSLLGALFTPIPWKLLDDSAIWTQNWSLIPKLPRGPVTFTSTACALCPGGCAVKARRVNGYPVSFAGSADHPVNGGVLCPAGLSAHHLATHPLRLHKPFAFTGRTPESTLSPVSLDDVTARLASTLRNARQSQQGCVAVLDQRPGRAISGFYAEFLAAFPGGTYIVAPGSEDDTLAATAALAGTDGRLFGYDFENTRVILSFGAPLLDGGFTPGRMAKLFNARNERNLKLIQIESVQSRTALHADTWIPVVPGTEAALAFSIGHVILRDGLAPASTTKGIKDLQSYMNIVSGFAPESAAARCGIAPDAIVAVAHQVSANPSIVLSGSDPGGGAFTATTEAAIAALNVLLGNVNRTGGIRAFDGIPAGSGTGTPATRLAEVPDHSIRILFIDGAESGNAYPSTLLRRKLVPEGGTVVHMSPYLSARSGIADYLVPMAAAYESIEEISTPSGFDRAVFALSMPLMPSRSTSVDAVAFLASIGQAAGLTPFAHPTLEARLRKRAQDILASKRGALTLPGGTATPVTDVTTDEDFWKGLTDGGYWIGDATDRKIAALSLLPAGLSPESLRQSREAVLPEGALRLIPSGWKNTMASCLVAPVMSKLFQESRLRNLGGEAHINPATLEAAGIADGSLVKVTTPSGAATVRAVADAAVMPGVLLVSVGPSPNNAPPRDRPEAEGILDICAVQPDGTWRITQATIARA